MNGLFKISTRTATVVVVLHLTIWLHITAAISNAEQELIKGYKATPDSSISSFQSLLNDSTGNFSLGFLKIDKTKLAVIIRHVPSSEQIWTANPTTLATWSDQTHFLFNGSLVLSGADGTVYWSTATDGDTAILLNSSNLQVRRGGGSEDSPVVLWQSFDFPYDTLVVNQNFSSEMKIVSANGNYYMRLGNDFIGLYEEIKEGKNQTYYRRKALQAKAMVVNGGGPLHLRLNYDGYLGLYQNGSLPVDLQAFSTFQKLNNGFLRLRIEDDGNLRGFFWEGSKWVLDYEAISEHCELPNPCGSYGLCEPGSSCSCLDNRTEYTSGHCLPQDSGNFCGGGVARNNFWVLRRTGVDLPFKELMNYKTGFTLTQCESFCETNCSCWGSLFNNSTRFCYWVDYPIQTVVAADDDQSKVGYFKVREAPAKVKVKVGLQIGLGVLAGIVGIVVVIIGFAGFQARRRRQRGIGRFFEEDDGPVSPGPYKDLGSASFKSIEMSSNSGFGRVM